MIPSSTFDPSRRLDLYFRINRAYTKDFVFVDADLADLDITGHTFTLIIKTNPGAISNVISLTLGFGLEFAVYETNVLTAEVTSAQTLIDEGEYYWELYVSDIQETWLNGKAYFHNGIFDGIDEP